MSNEIYTDVNRKNSLAFRQTIEQQNKKIEELTIELNNLRSQLSPILQEFAVLKNLIMMSKVQSYGSGPSVK